MISSINYLLFSSDELSTFANRTLSLTEAKKVQLQWLVPFMTNASQKYSLYRSALERETRNPLIKIQNTRNLIRDKAFLAFRSGCESAAVRTKDGFSAAGSTLLGIIRKQGWSAQFLGMKAKSSVIWSIISEMRAKHVSELTLTGLDELLDELETAQNEFESVAQQVVEVSSTTNEPTVAETRPELVAALRSMLQFIGLQQIGAPSADLTELTNALNELIVLSLSTAKASDTRTENLKKANVGTN